MAKWPQDKYYPTRDFLGTLLGHKSSYLWRSLLEGRNFLFLGMRTQIGNGLSTAICIVGGFLPFIGIHFLFFSSQGHGKTGGRPHWLQPDMLERRSHQTSLVASWSRSNLANPFKSSLAKEQANLAPHFEWFLHCKFRIQGGNELQEIH